MPCNCKEECFCDGVVKMGLFWKKSELPSFKDMTMQEVVEKFKLFDIAKYYLMEWKLRNQELDVSFSDRVNGEFKFKEFLTDDYYSVHIYCYPVTIH